MFIKYIQLNDEVTELKIKQKEEKAKNEMLTRRIKQLQESSKVVFVPGVAVVTVCS